MVEIKSSNVKLMSAKLLKLSRTILLIKDDEAFKRFMLTSNGRLILERYISETFDKNHKAGYFINKHHRKVQVSTFGPLEHGALPKLSLMEIGKGFDEFVKGTFHHTRTESNEPVGFQLTLFTPFLHQEITDEKFIRFWLYFTDVVPARASVQLQLIIGGLKSKVFAAMRVKNFSQFHKIYAKILQHPKFL
ncbi:hypothetical protein DFH28DRAFT_921508 [Melampsora americana]|nr:hypothetical protein DFH28DRAFT_921508 [Melampsora americana]